MISLPLDADWSSLLFFIYHCMQMTFRCAVLLDLMRVTRFKVLLENCFQLNAAKSEAPIGFLIGGCSESLCKFKQNL